MSIAIDPLMVSSPRLSNKFSKKSRYTSYLFFRVPLFRNSIEPRNKPGMILISYPLDILMLKGFRSICDCPLVLSFFMLGLLSNPPLPLT